MGVSGLTHAHVHGLLSQIKRDNIVVVGIAQPNRKLALRFAK